MKNFIWVILLFSSFTYAHFEEDKDHHVELTFGGWSHHINTDTDYNETHDLIGVEYNDFQVFTFVNSYDYRSYGVGYTHTVTLVDKYLFFGVSVGVVDGYETVEGFGRITPYLEPHLEFYYENFGLQLGFLPIFTDDVSGVLVLAGKYRFSF